VAPLLQPSELVRLLWAAARLRAPALRLMAAAGKRLSEELTGAGGALGSEDLAVLAWSLAALGGRPPGLLEVHSFPEKGVVWNALLHVVQAMAGYARRPAVLATFTARSITMTLAAYARLEVYDPELIAALGDRLLDKAVLAVGQPPNHEMPLVML
jgi:hypothetical protein